MDAKKELNKLAILAHDIKSEVAKIKAVQHVPITELYKGWAATGLGMVGASYSLYEAALLLSQKDFRQKRNLDKVIEEGETVLKKIVPNKSRILSKGLESWFVGYYLNTAEQRIAAVLHRILKVFVDPKTKKYATELIQEIDKQCFMCGKSLKELLSIDCKEILNGFSKNVKRSSLSMISENKNLSPGKSLRLLWDIVNELKHQPLPWIDEKEIRPRWWNTFYGLSELLIIYKEISEVSILHHHLKP